MFASGGFAVACGAAAVLIAFAASFSERRPPLIGAAAAGLAVQALLRMTSFGFHGAPSLAAAATIVPILATGYRYAPRWERRRARRLAAAAGIASAVCVALLIAVAVLVQPRVKSAISAATSGFKEVQGGDRVTAVQRLDQAAKDFDGAAKLLSAPWLRPVRMLPVVAQQAEAVQALAEEGRGLSRAASAAANKIDYEKLRVTGGTIDLAALQATQKPIEDAATALERAAHHLSQLPTDWLLPPIRDRFDELNTQVAGAAPQARIASEVVNVGPAMLGANGPRRYVVVFGTPAETRELGGFVGNFAELTATNGKLSLTKSGRGLEVSDPSGKAGWKLDDGDYLERYAGYQVSRFFGNVSASPDFLEVSHVVEQLYPQAVGEKVDGVFYMDPIALAALLEVTGPVRLKEASVKLTAKNAAQLLLVDQYTSFDKPTRKDFLDEATKAVFEELTTGNLPTPRVVANALSPVIDDGRLLGHSLHADEQALFAKLGFDGAFPPPDQGDFLSVRQANQAPNKIDAYLQRDIFYDAKFRPDTGEVDATLTVKLINKAPAAGLPVDVIGNRHERPFGTNQMNLVVYSKLRAVQATSDGKPVGIGSTPRFGRFAYTLELDVPPESTVTIVLQLRGVLEPSREYRLTLAVQPLANPDAVHATLAGTHGWLVGASSQFEIIKGAGRATAEDRRSQVLSARLTGP
jgi:hypothetical protein